MQSPEDFATEYLDALDRDEQPQLAKRVATRDAEVAQTARAQLIEQFAPLCRQCLKRTEPERWCYVIPTCFACLPPPPPIEAIKLGPKA
ncbi:MAG TPA: hypothetical protein VGJ91_20000 [Polyangiaceae bacterium]|jgi:hypothetical protein